jgi:hypothetical protein
VVMRPLRMVVIKLIFDLPSLFSSQDSDDQNHA